MTRLRGPLYQWGGIFEKGMKMRSFHLMLAVTALAVAASACAPLGEGYGSTSSAYPGTSNYEPGKENSQYGINSKQPSEKARRSPASYGGGALSTIM